VSEGAVFPGLLDGCHCLDALSSILAHREAADLVTESLLTLIEQFGATAGSLFYATRPPLRVRRGMFSDALTDTMDQWEASIEGRIAAGSWRIGKQREPLLAVRPIRGTGDVVLYSPLLDANQVVGMISLAFHQSQVPTGNRRVLLASFLQAAGMVLGLVEELALTKERLGQLSLFYQVAQSMASTFDLNKVLDDTLQLATAVLDASASALMLVDESTGELVFEYAYGEMGNILRKQRTAPGEGIAGWVASHGVPVVANDARADPRFSPVVDTRTGFLTESVICAPIQIRSETIGVLEALNKRSVQGFDSEDLRLMVTTANQAAIAIENARLYQSLRDERDRIIQAQEDVRRQVARNLHDGTVQFLSAISMGLDHLERLLQFKPEAARAELDALRELTRQATRQARLALFELRPLILETQGLVPALEAYVQQLQDSEMFDIHLETAASLPDVENSVASTIFAIVQEAVNNAKKHASARDVWLRLLAENNWLKVIVKDNGKGFDPEAVERNYDRTGSIGLLNMRERAELIDGRLEIESCMTPPQSGTCVTLHVPIRESQAKKPHEPKHRNA
jgi:signal transduction histidine kinase